MSEKDPQKRYVSENLEDENIFKNWLTENNNKA